jgi:hypothetical protein
MIYSQRVLSENNVAATLPVRTEAAITLVTWNRSESRDSGRWLPDTSIQSGQAIRVKVPGHSSCEGALPRENWPGEDVSPTPQGIVNGVL